MRVNIEDTRLKANFTLGVKSTLFLSVRELYKLLTYCENSNPTGKETKHSALLYMTIWLYDKSKAD